MPLIFVQPALPLVSQTSEVQSVMVVEIVAAYPEGTRLAVQSGPAVAMVDLMVMMEVVADEVGLVVFYP